MSVLCLSLRVGADMLRVRCLQGGPLARVGALLPTCAGSESLLLGFQKFRELVFKQTLLKPKSYKLTIKRVTLQTKVINTKSSSLTNYFTIIYYAVITHTMIIYALEVIYACFIRMRKYYIIV